MWPLLVVMSLAVQANCTVGINGSHFGSAGETYSYALYGDMPIQYAITDTNGTVIRPWRNTTHTTPRSFTPSAGGGYVVQARSACNVSTRHALVVEGASTCVPPPMSDPEFSYDVQAPDTWTNGTSQSITLAVQNDERDENLRIVAFVYSGRYRYGNTSSTWTLDPGQQRTGELLLTPMVKEAGTYSLKVQLFRSHRKTPIEWRTEIQVSVPSKQKEPPPVSSESSPTCPSSVFIDKGPGRTTEVPFQVPKWWVAIGAMGVLLVLLWKQ